MIATWATELYLDKLNSLEDSTTNSSNELLQEKIKSEIETTRQEFQEFINKHKVVISFVLY